MAMICCWRCGSVSVEAREPDGVLVLARGPRKRLEHALAALARHSHDGKTLLVPGVPEAVDDDAALDAVAAFKSRLENHFMKRKKTSR